MLTPPSPLFRPLRKDERIKLYRPFAAMWNFLHTRLTKNKMHSTKSNRTNWIWEGACGVASAGAGEGWVPKKRNIKIADKLHTRRQSGRAPPAPKLIPPFLANASKNVASLAGWPSIRKGAHFWKGEWGTWGVVNGRMDAGATMTTTSKRRMQRRKRCVYS